jgi:hypothetical protein
MKQKVKAEDALPVALELCERMKPFVDRFSSLPALSERIPDKIICPICLGTGWHAPNWWVSLVIRTGGKDTNLKLATGARKLGRTLHAYGCGVEDLKTGEVVKANSEQDVFRLCAVDYIEPNQRK